MTFKNRLSIGVLMVILIAAIGYWLIPQPDFEGETLMNSEELIPVEGSFTLRFDQAMNASSVERAFKITPALAGAFVWSDRKTLQYKPDSALTIGDRYQVILEASAKSLWGKSLIMSRTLDFVVTGPPFVEFVTPSSNPKAPHTMAVDQMITVGFDRPMETKGDTNHFLRMNSPAEGELVWLNSQVLQFTPKQWNYDTTYTFTVPAGLLAKNGGTTERDFTWEV
ncbi:MAG: Ig-like domain-containing protein, partial [Patescibacteria group bacterium]